MSVLKVDTINEKTSGNGVAIPGHVVQTVQSETDRPHIATSSTSYTASGVSLSITPKFANSVILIDFFIPMTHTPNSNGAMNCRLYKGNTALTSRNYSQGYLTNGDQYKSIKIEGMDDSHNSTSSLTYEVYFKSEGGGQVFLCHNGSSTLLKLWEIAQ